MGFFRPHAPDGVPPEASGRVHLPLTFGAFLLGLLARRLAVRLRARRGPPPAAAGAAVTAPPVGRAGDGRTEKRAARGPVVVLRNLRKEDVPARLRPEFYFDFKAHPFEHAELLTGAHDLMEVLGSIHSYAEGWLEAAWARRQGASAAAAPAGTRVMGGCPEVCLDMEAGSEGEAVFAPETLLGRPPAAGDPQAHAARHLQVGRGAKVLGGVFDLRAGSIFLGEGVTVEPGAYVIGPAIIGARSVLRTGAYVRGDAIIGQGVYLRGELKNVVVMDRAELCHPGYAGDSIVGFKGHFGCQALTANLGLFGAELAVALPDDEGAMRVNLGRTKVGAVIGDHSQLGCNSVTDPATFIGPRTHVYPLSRLSCGFYGPSEIIKNRPEACGAIVRVPLRAA